MLLQLSFLSFLIAAVNHICGTCWEIDFVNLSVLRLVYVLVHYRLMQSTQSVQDKKINSDL